MLSSSILPKQRNRPQTAQPRYSLHKSPLPVVTGVAVSEAFTLPSSVCSLSLAHFPRFQHSRMLRRRRPKSKGELQEVNAPLLVRPARGKLDGSGTEKRRGKGTEDIEPKKSAFLTGISLGEVQTPPSPRFSLRRVKTLSSMIPIKGLKAESSKESKANQWTCTWSNEIISRSCQTLDYQSGLPLAPSRKRVFLRLSLGPK
jgi:hypothetical protein